MHISNDKKKLIENSIAIALTQVVSYIIPLISLPYLSRVLGVEKFGLVFWAQSCIMYFIIFTEYGFNLSSVREIAINKNNINKISEIFNSVLFIKLFLIAISLSILSIIIILVPKFNSEWLLFYLTFFMVIGNSIYPMWFFQGIEHMKYITFLNILTKSIFLILIFCFIRKPSDYIYVAVLNSLGFLISGIIAILIAVIKFKVKLFIPSKETIIKEFKSSTEFFFARASETLYTNTNSFLLGIVANPVLVGYYVAAEKICNAVRYLMDPIGVTLYPYMSKSKNIKLYKKILYISLLIIFLICIFVYFFSPKIIVLFYGRAMYPAYKILQIFCITIFISVFSGLIGYPFLGALGFPNIVNRSLPIAAGIQILILFLFYIAGVLNIKTITYLTILPYSIMLIIRLYSILKLKLWSYND